MTANQLQDLVGRRFGRLTVIESIELVYKRGMKWRCACDCGQITAVITNSLNSGHTKSCGCLHREKSSEVGRQINLSHGDARQGRQEPEYTVWSRMKRRCYNKRDDAYRYYGGKGVVVCDEWKNSYTAFLRDMGRRPTPHHQIDRIDSNGDYEPDNCRWVTRLQQAGNKTNNRYLSACGQTLTVTEWSHKTGLPMKLIHNRITRGWSDEAAVTTPKRRMKPRSEWNPEA